MQKLHFIELDSTNDYLKNNYESLNNLTFVSADYQIKGRGRNERKWFSSKGENLLFSILIKENITLKEPGLYSIYCIVEIAKYLEKIGLKNVLIKWPNDIYVNDKKILGVLSEGKYLGSNLLYVIVGIGLNVNQQYLNEQLIRPFTSIYNELNHPIDIERLKDEIFPLLEKLLLNIKSHNSKASSKYEKKIDRGPILPSGSCFDTIALEVGVNMIENTKQKTGGKDFFKRYNKYSMETYNKQLKDTMTTNTMMTNPGYRSLPRLFTSTDYNNTNTNNLTETYSSNLYGANNTSSIAFKKRNLSTLTGSNFMKTTSSNANEFNPLLKTTNSMMLRTTLETGDDYNEPLSVNRKDIFKEKAKEKQSRTKQLDEMNIFARTILSNDKWGSGVMNNTTKNKGITLPSKGKKNLNEFRSTGSFKKLPRGDRLRATHSKFTLSMDNFAFLNK